MSALFEELGFAETPIGEISLRRRHVLSLKTDVFEIILGDEHLMSSLFTASEVALGKLGVEACEGGALEIAVGGLGMGYTAAAALESDRVGSLVVVEFLQAIIDWHDEGLMPLDPPLSADDRCRIVQGDFFALAASDEGLDPSRPGRTFDAILIDIDHTPDWLLDERSAGFYSVAGLKKLTRHLKPGGLMGLWSDAVTDPAFVDRLETVFARAKAEPVTFHNPYQNKPFTQTVYLGWKAGAVSSLSRE